MGQNETADIKLGVFQAMSAYLMWGLLPLYWKMLQVAGALEILSNRIFWSMVSILIYLAFRGTLAPFWQETKMIFRDRKKSIGLLAATTLISINWGLYIWAVNSGNILATSFGYYITPLLNIFFGFIFLKERFNLLEKISVGVAFAGVAYLTMNSGRIPWAALMLALSFSLYGLVKKRLQLNAIHSLGWETLLLTPLTLAYLIYLAFQGQSHLNFSTEGLLLILSGPVTAIPLILFGASVKKIPLSMLAFTQYLSPTMAFFLGVFLYREPFSKVQLISFSLVWLSVAIYLFANLQKSRLQKRRRSNGYS